MKRFDVITFILGASILVLTYFFVGKFTEKKSCNVIQPVAYTCDEDKRVREIIKAVTPSNMIGIYELTDGSYYASEAYLVPGDCTVYQGIY